MSAKQIKQRLEVILDFMQPHWEFVNCHMVNFLTDHHWDRFIPAEMRLEVTNKEQAWLCIENVFWRQSAETASFPSITKFISECRNHSLEHFEEILWSTVDFKKEILLQNQEKSSISIKEFLTDKKRHEVEIMAELVDDLINSKFHKNEQKRENVFIVDAGDGKGYLSSRLSLEYGHKVLGIDANETNTENALERNRKLQRAWSGLVKRADLLQNGINPPRRGKKPAKLAIESKTIKENSNYRTTAKYIDTNLCLTELLCHHFNSADKETKLQPQICLTGLHTCGNLAPTCLRVFHAEPNCRILCNIGCCYHFLKEAYTTSRWEHSTPHTTSDDCSDFGFPMSKFLRLKNIKLGRNARMLASQCIERTLADCELPNISLFYRALLEIIMHRRKSEMYKTKETIQVGRIRKYNNFNEYFTQCAKKTKSPDLLDIDTQFIDNIEMEFAHQRIYLELFYLIRMHFAPVLESLLLLDRLLYLKELGYEQSYLVSAFDAIISPRHYAIIALRD